MDIASSLGERVRTLRLARRWTLDEAATRLDISRRSLVLIESGDANPALSSLLSIAQGFGIELTDLLLQEPTASPFVLPEAATTLWTSESGGRGDLCVGVGPVELWRFELFPGDRRASSAHAPGSLECILVLSGVVAVRLDTDGIVLGKNQSAAFASDVEHEYRNDTDKRATFVLAVFDPITSI